MSDRSDVEMFIFAADCEETEEKRKTRNWINDIFVSRFTEGEFYLHYTT
jgi:hypothetical protein